MDDDDDEVGATAGWREDQDLFALGASAYLLMHGDLPPKVKAPPGSSGGGGGGGSSSSKWRLRRYWDGETWEAVFDGLMGADVAGLSPEQVGAWTGGVCEGFCMHGPYGRVSHTPTCLSIYIHPSP